MIRRCIPVLLVGLSALAGCLHPVSVRIDESVQERASVSRDLQPVSHASEPWTGATEDSNPSSSAKEEKKGKDNGLGGAKSPPISLTIPEEIPGGKLPPIKLPPIRKENEQERAKAIEKLYPPLPPIGNDLPDPTGPEGRPLTLADLQRLAMANNPLIRQAAARIEEARGAAIQAGLPPNPTVGYEGDTINTTGGAGYHGGFIEQRVVTAGKLQLARAAAAMDLRNAEIALKKAEADLMTRVRGAYFGVLVAQESVRINRSLLQFTYNIYQIYVEQLRRGGFAAPYEPMYLRALASQTRGSLIQARNRRIAAWKQLAASMGTPAMPPTALAGRLDIPVPNFDQTEVLKRVLSSHTDVLTAQASVQQAEYQLQLARVTPIPDVNLRLMVQKDTTGSPYGTSPSLAMSIPIPVWDRNQGGILQAQSALYRLHGETPRVQNELTRTLAEAYERYDNNRQLLSYYRDQILPDLVQVYRGVYARFRDEPAPPIGNPPGLTDLVVAQQNLATSVGTYISVLGELWRGVVDVADLLQTPDLFSVQTATHAVAEIPDLEKVAPAPTTLPVPKSDKPEKDGPIDSRSSLPRTPVPADTVRHPTLPRLVPGGMTLPPISGSP